MRNFSDSVHKVTKVMCKNDSNHLLFKKWLFSIPLLGLFLKSFAYKQQNKSFATKP